MDNLDMSNLFMRIEITGRRLNVYGKGTLLIVAAKMILKGKFNHFVFK